MELVSSWCDEQPRGICPGLWRFSYGSARALKPQLRDGEDAQAQHDSATGAKKQRSERSAGAGDLRAASTPCDSMPSPPYLHGRLYAHLRRVRHGLETHQVIATCCVRLMARQTPTRQAKPARWAAPRSPRRFATGRARCLRSLEQWNLCSTGGVWASHGVCLLVSDT